MAHIYDVYGKMMGVEFTAESPELINVTDYIKKVGKEVDV